MSGIHDFTLYTSTRGGGSRKCPIVATNNVNHEPTRKFPEIIMKRRGATGIQRELDDLLFDKLTTAAYYNFGCDVIDDIYIYIHGVV